MNSAVILVLLVAVMSVCSAEPNQETKCSKLPKISHDARKTVEPYGDRWMLVWSNVPGQKCLQFQYNGNLNGNESLAEVLFIDKDTAMTQNAISIVNQDMNMWNVTMQMDNSMTSYRKLFISDNGHYFCIYACDTETDTVGAILGFALNKAGADKIKTELQTNFPKLKLMDGTKIVDSFPKTCKVLNKKHDIIGC